MDQDPNDLLSTNNFIDTPNLTPKISRDNVEEFKRFYEKDLQQANDNKLQAKIKTIELKDVIHDENYDENNSLALNKVQNNSHAYSKDITRDIKHLETLVSIDSRDRIKSNDPKASNFTIFLGKTFRNVKKIELVSLEFPNTNAVINSGNNMIYWRNKEDIDQDITITVKGIIQYPIYSTMLIIGSYTVNSLQTEILVEVNSVTRRQGTENGGSDTSTTSKYHFFVITLNINTDLVTFYSLIMVNLSNNSLSTTLSSGTIKVITIRPHGYINGQLIYINGATQIAGISASVINGFQYISVIAGDTNIFSYTVNVQASVSTTGGGNTIRTGSYAPFQFLWGTESNTVAQNIGYSLENSSQLITTNIQTGQNIYQLIITTVQTTGFIQSYNYIGQTITVGTLFNGGFLALQGGTFQITDIPSSNTILVQVSENSYETLISSSATNKIQFIDLINNTTYFFDTLAFEQYLIPSLQITTLTSHNYTLNDLGNSITLSGTEQTPGGPNNDGPYTIGQLPSANSIIVPGTLTNPINITSGSIPRQNPLTTWTVPIKQIDKNYMIVNGLKYSLITTTVPHLLNTGDSVYFYNVVAVPNLTTYYTISSVVTSTKFYIQLEFGSVDISSGSAYIGTSLITVSYPSHGFNSIINVSNDILYTVGTVNIVSVSGTTQGIGITVTNTDMSTTIISNVTPLSNNNYPGLVNTTQSIRIQTLNSHNLSVNNKVRLTFTGNQPTMLNGNNLTGGGYTVIEIINSDTFVIINKPMPFLQVSNIPTNINGILGMSNSFYLYGIKSIGGINQNLLNSIKFSVRDIYDTNTFTFMCGTFATSVENGGGSAIYISSLLHGFNGTQSNTKNNTLNRSINLEGENYSFLTCPVLNTMLNTGKVTNVFARISLDQPPGYVCFTYLSNPKIFDIVPLDILEQLTFSVYNYNNTLFEFNDIDWSFCLKITESIDYTTHFNLSSRRGITDTTSVNK